jgi:hypothetical protein
MHGLIARSLRGPGWISAFFKISCLTALLSVFPALPVYGQDAVGALEGLVSDRTEAPVAGATISLKDVDTNAVRTQTSNAEGRYRFALLSVGRYTLTADAP